MARKGGIAEAYSEPGTGPSPAYLDVEREDKAVRNGWRRDSPPIAYPEVWPLPDPEPEPEE